MNTCRMEVGTWNLLITYYQAVLVWRTYLCSLCCKTRVFSENGITMNLSWKNFLFTMCHVRIGLTETMLSKKTSVFQKLSEKQQGRVCHFLFCTYVSFSWNRNFNHKNEILAWRNLHIYFWFKVRYFKIIQDCDIMKFIFSSSSCIRRNYSSKCKTAVRAELKCSLLDEAFIGSLPLRQLYKLIFFFLSHFR